MYHAPSCVVRTTSQCASDVYHAKPSVLCTSSRCVGDYVSVCVPAHVCLIKIEDDSMLRLTNGHVQQPPGPDNGEQAVDVVKDDEEHLGLRGGCGLCGVIG